MMTNPIAEALGLSIPSPAANRRIGIVIEFRGTALIGTAAYGDRFESYYRASHDRTMQFGSAIAAPYAHCADDALRVLAQAFIGRNPRKGQVAEIAAALKREAKAHTYVIAR